MLGCSDDGEAATASQSDESETTSAQTGDGDGDGEGGDGDDMGDGDGEAAGDGDGEAAPEFFDVGFDVADISPDELDLAEGFYMGGYGFYTERGAAQGVADPIYVRSMALGYGAAEGGIFAVADSVGMGNLWTRQIRASVAEATGLSTEQIVIASTHTHAGPDFQGLWGGVPEVYRERAIAVVVDSMTAAWDAREPAQLRVSSASADNRNRRGWEFTDDVLFALQAEALDDGALLGTTVAFAAHPVVLGDENLLVSRDFCGYAVDDLEVQTGAPVLYFNGVQGDVSPKVPEGQYEDDFERAEAYGLHISAQSQVALADMEVVEVDFHRGYRSFQLEVTNDLFLLAAQGGILDYEFDLGEENRVSSQIAYFRFGQQLQLIAFPGESLTRNGLPLREAMSTPHGAVLGLAGDALGYFVPSDEWMTGLNDDYEESISVGEQAGDLTQAEILALMGADPGA